MINNFNLFIVDVKLVNTRLKFGLLAGSLALRYYSPPSGELTALRRRLRLCRRKVAAAVEFDTALQLNVQHL
jgi:hypothetical protein